MSDGEKRHVTLEDLQEQLSGIEVMLEELKVLTNADDARACTQAILERDRYRDYYLAPADVSLAAKRLPCGCLVLDDPICGKQKLYCPSHQEQLSYERSQA